MADVTNDVVMETSTNEQKKRAFGDITNEEKKKKKGRSKKQ